MSRHHYIINLLCLAAALFVALIVTYWETSVTFNVTIVTENIVVRTTEEPSSRWFLSDVEIREEGESCFKLFQGSVSFNPKVSITIERISNGPLRILIRSLLPEQSVGNLYDQTDEFLKRLGKRVIFRIQNVKDRTMNGKTIVLPLTGIVEAGRELRFSTSPSVGLLRSGKVSMLAKTLWGRTAYDAGTVQLDIGDRFIVDKPQSSSYGFVLANEKPGITSVFRTVGKRGRVIRFGSEGYTISSSIFTRITNDRVVQGLWMTFFFLFSSFGILPRKKKREELPNGNRR